MCLGSVARNRNQREKRIGGDGNRTRLPDLIAMAKIQQKDTLKSITTTSNERVPCHAPHSTPLHGATIECATLFSKIECKCRARSSSTGEKLSLQPALKRRLGYILYSLPLHHSLSLSVSFFVCCINCNTNRRAAKCERGTVLSICVSAYLTDTQIQRTQPHL